jgi:hypothetical protein
MENQIILYNNVEGKVTIKVTWSDFTFWLPQKAISTLFGVETPAVSKHLANIYETGELIKEATISILETVQQEGNREVKRSTVVRTFGWLKYGSYGAFMAHIFHLWRIKHQEGNKWPDYRSVGIIRPKSKIWPDYWPDYWPDDRSAKHQSNNGKSNKEA